MIGAAPAFRHAVELAHRVAATNAAVMISGESGTGKEGLARLIHGASRRANGLFVPISCAGIPEALLECEMFGVRTGSGASTGRDMPGLLETANGGTVFLGEVTDMPAPLQAKLLRVLRVSAVQRIGSAHDHAIVDIRVLSAVDCDPREAVASGALREDLFHRLRVVEIALPPLRERPEDIPLLARYFLSLYWKRHRSAEQRPARLSSAAIKFLCAQPWPGNVRELQNVVENVAVLAEPGRDVQPEDMRLRGEAAVGAGAHTLPPRMLDDTYYQAKERIVAQFEREYLARLVASAGGNMSRAARLAGIDRTTLYRLVERHSDVRDEARDLVERR